MTYIKAVAIGFFAFSCLAVKAGGQSSPDHRALFVEGISADLGVGQYIGRDEVVSKNIYSGTLPYVAAHWARFHTAYGYHVSLEYRQSSEIANVGLPTEVTQLSMSRARLYPAGKLTLFPWDSYLYLGPSTEFYLFFNQPRLEGEGLYLNFSFLALLSLGISSDVVMPVTSSLRVEGRTRLALLSFGLQMPDLQNTDEDSEPPIRLLNPFSCLHAAIDCGLRYQVSPSISLKMSYKLAVTRVTILRSLVTASDNIMVSLSYHFW